MTLRNIASNFRHVRLQHDRKLNMDQKVKRLCFPSRHLRIDAVVPMPPRDCLRCLQPTKNKIIANLSLKLNFVNKKRFAIQQSFKRYPL